jgi:ATP-dependent DNA ligase
MRCGLYSEKTKKKISFPAIIQLKADATYRAVTVDNGEVIFTSRSGEKNEYPELAKYFSELKDGVYIGEMLIRNISNRSEINGLLNSDHPPHDRIYMQLWDYVSLDEYSRPKDKKKKTPYNWRLTLLNRELNKIKTAYPDIQLPIELIESHEVDSIPEALEKVSEWMKQGFEGGILKDQSNIFVDHTSPTQLKLKLEIDADVRCTGFYEGKRGTKREKTFGGITYTTDDGKVQGRTSGFTDQQLKDFNNRRQELTGRVFTIEFNDITKARDSETWALSHPRFIEFRRDKDETDTLERIQEMKKMAMNLGG